MEPLAWTNITLSDHRALARGISAIENGLQGYRQAVEDAPASHAPVIGITGPPGAGKSTLVNGLIREITDAGQTVAVLCVDPSSPFHRGALLGDRIRMNQWYNHPGVYIRSLSTRGSLGGLHPAIFGITDLLKLAGFDQIIIETVGIGQSEVEIAGIADVTVVVLVPESGDDVQAMKAGLMEIADLFVVNKCDHPAAARFILDLRNNLHTDTRDRNSTTPILEVIATRQQGIPALLTAIRRFLSEDHPAKRNALLAERAYRLILEYRMSGVDRSRLMDELKIAENEKDFTVYRFAASWLQKNPLS